MQILSIVLLALFFIAALSAADEGKWSYRITGGLREGEGLLQVLPPHETEWGTVCGNSAQMVRALSAGADPAEASALFFSPRDAVVACRGAGYNVSFATASRYQSTDGWGTGPMYMANIDCSTAKNVRSLLRRRKKSDLPSGLEECFFVLLSSEQAECSRADDVYLKCDSSMTESTDDVVAMSNRITKKYSSLASSSSAMTSVAPTTVYIVLSSSRNETTLPSQIASLIYCSPSQVKIGTCNQKGNYKTCSLSFVTGTSAPAPAPTADIGVTTMAPAAVTGSMLMAQFLSLSLFTVEALEIFELRTDGPTAYGSINLDISAQPIFSIEPIDTMGDVAAGSVNFGYFKGKSGSAQTLAGGVCSVDKTVRPTTAATICTLMGFGTPSAIIPNFGNTTGLIVFSDLRVYSTTNYTRVNSDFYNKKNDCFNGDVVGVLCGSGTFDSEVATAYKSYCIAANTPVPVVKSKLQLELDIPAYRFLWNGNCFSFGVGYDFKDSSSTLQFTQMDLVYIFDSINRDGLSALFGIERVTVSVITPPYQPPPQDVNITVLMATSKNSTWLTNFIVSRYGVTIDDINVWEDDIIVGTLPQQKPTLAPTKPPTTPAPSTKVPVATQAPSTPNSTKRNSTATKQLTITEELTISLSLDETASREITPINRSTDTPTTAAPTSAPGESLDGKIRRVGITFHFQDPATQFYNNLTMNHALFDWEVFAESYLVITPAPPPPDMRGKYAGIGIGVIIFVVLIIVALVVIRKVFYSRTSKRWDDDYVMMNMQVLTIPLHDIEMETPKRNKKSMKEHNLDTEERDTAELF